MGLRTLFLLGTLLSLVLSGAAAPAATPAGDESRNTKAVTEEISPHRVRRFAIILGDPLGQRLRFDQLARLLQAIDNRPDPAIHPALALSLLPFFDAFDVDYGSAVNDDDVRALGGRVGVEVPAAVDQTTVDRIAAAASTHPDISYPVFATYGPVSLRRPSADVELIGYHQSNHDGARPLEPTGDTPSMTLPSRNRDTASRGAADIVASPTAEIRAPVTGTVIRAGTYVLYCRYSDDFAVIEPDDRPGYEVKLLHINGVRVRPGDRVVAGQTVLASGPTVLPFESQVDEFTQPRNWPHVHVEVVDPSIPDRPSPGGGC